MDPRTTPDPGKPGVVLIADDNAEARRLLAIRVRREGYDVLLAEDGHQALDLILHHPVDVLLLDIYMPVMDGFQVLEAIRADPARSHLPILMISGGGDQDDLIRCIELGAVDYLPKPLNQALLKARLAACVAGKRQRDRELQGRRPGIQAPIPRPVPPAPDALPGRVGRIALERLIGQGSMGRVFLGRHELLDLPVAVKLLRPELLNTPEMRARSLREARLAARIAHRHVVRLHEAGETEGGIYLAYEYVDGGTLGDLLDRSPGRQLDIPTAARITREIAEGLAEINRLGATHRDIKPRNILLTRDGEVKIADLGLAKQFGPEAPGSATLTAEHTVVGTPLYMAPEQAEDGRELDIRCDLYALGVVLYEMLTGRPPFTRRTPLAILLSHLCSAVPPPSGLRPDTPPWLENVCLRLLAKDRNDRYPWPEALLDDLRAAGK